MESVAHNPPALKTRRGFNLIEAAIVLGVVGLVIGGIWVAAAKMIESNRQTETIKIVIFCASKMREILKDVPAHSYADETNLSRVAISIGAIPPKMHTLNMGQTPYGDIGVNYETGYGGRDFKIALSGLSISACNQLIIKLANGTVNNGLVRVLIEPAHVWTQFPIEIENIKDGCNSLNDKRLFFQYNY